MSMVYKLEELLEGKGNRYRLVVIASQRAKKLNAGVPALIESRAHKITTIALEEVALGKVKYQKRPTPLRQVVEGPGEAGKEEKKLKKKEVEK